MCVRVACIARVNVHPYVRVCVCVCVRSAVWQGARRLIPHNGVRMRRSYRDPETMDARRETEHDDDDDDDDDDGNGSEWAARSSFWGSTQLMTGAGSRTAPAQPEV